MWRLSVLAHADKKVVIYVKQQIGSPAFKIIKLCLTETDIRSKFNMDEVLK
jgi:hypothetical protein